MTGPIYERLKQEAMRKEWQEARARLLRETFFPTFRTLMKALNECEEKSK